MYTEKKLERWAENKESERERKRVESTGRERKLILIERTKI